MVKKKRRYEGWSRLKLVRHLRKKTQSDLAEGIGIDVKTLRQYETGILSLNTASIGTVLRFCNELYCPLEELLEDVKTLEAWKQYRRRCL